MSIKHSVQKIVTAVETIAAQFGGPGTIEVPLSAFVLASTGGPLAVYADSANNPSVAGIQVTDSEARTIRWNNAATCTGILAQVPIPRDFDPAVSATMYLTASKVGATVGDAVTFTIGAFNSGVVAALHDADADFGGVSSAMTGDATSKRVQRVSRSLAASDLAAYPATMSISIAFTAGTLGTDDLCLHRVWIAYTRRNPTDVAV